MIKKILTSGALTIIMFLSTGCHKQPAPKTIIVENNTTKETLIPHNKDVKKAVAILILKMKALEEALAIKNNSKDISDAETNGLKEELLRQKEQLQSYNDRIEANKLKACDCKIEKININTAPDAVQSSSPSQNTTEYDNVIRDFVEDGSLK